MAPEKSNPISPGRRSTLRPDLSTLAGIVIALAGILGGLILEKGKIQDVTQGTAALIVLGGTFGAVLVTTPMPIVVRAVRGLRGVFFEPRDDYSETIEALIRYAGQARKNGIVSLESEAVTISDPFLRKALELAVDGTDLQEIRKMMDLDISTSERSTEAEVRVWEAAGGYAPTIGIIGAVMGLIQVMKHLDDIQLVGHGIAGAFVATLYGVGTANIFFLPVASKLRARSRSAVVLKELMLEGVVGIVEGLNPTLIRLKLESFSDPPHGSAKSKRPKLSPAGASAKPSAAQATGQPVN